MNGDQPQAKAPFLPLDTVHAAAVKLAKCSIGSENVKENLQRRRKNICTSSSGQMVDPRGFEPLTF